MHFADWLQDHLPQETSIEERKIHAERTDYLLHPPPMMGEEDVASVCGALGGVGVLLGGVLTVDARSSR